MSIPSVGTASASSYQVSKSPTALAPDPAKEFMDFMKLTPAQRMEEQWLRSHGLTRKDLESMSPEKRDAIKKQMAQEIEDAMKRKTKAKAAGGVDILA